MKAEVLPRVRILRTGSLIFISFSVTVIDKRNFAELSDELDEILRDPNPQTVEIDLTGIRRIDELGMAFLQSLRESIKDVGGKSTIRGSFDQFKRAVGGTSIVRPHDERRVVRRPPPSTRW